MKSKRILCLALCLILTFASACSVPPAGGNSSSGGGSSTGGNTSSGETVHVHETVYVRAKAASCAEAGNKAYYVCSDCGKYFSDEKCKNEITLESTVVPALKHKTSSDKKDLKYDENGHYYECQNIGCTEKIDYSAHIFGEGVNISETQAEYVCTECGYKKYGEAIKAKLSGTVSSDKSIDFTKTILTLYNRTESYVYENKVDRLGNYSLEAPIGKTYKLLAYSREGVRGVSEEFSTLKDNNSPVSVTLTDGDMVGTVTLNGKSVKPVGKITNALIEDVLDDNAVDTSIDSDDVVWNGERRRYLMPLATRVKTGDFSFEPTLSSNMAYGYVGVGVTNGTGVLLLETSTYPGMDPGDTIVEFGSYDDGVYDLKFVMAVSVGGIISQQANNFKTTPSVRRRGNRFDLCMGDVLFATLDDKGLHMKGDYKMKNSPFFLARTCSEELASFISIDNEYGFLYTSERGLAGSIRYEYNFADYSAVSGKVTCDEAFKSNLQDTRIVAKGEKTYTFYNAIDENGNYSFELPYGTYDVVFSNPANLTGSLAGVVLNKASTSVSAVALENKKLATDSVIVNGNEVKLGKNVGEYTDVVTMNLKDDAEKTAIFDNGVIKGEAIHTVIMNIEQGWGSAIAGITDGESAIRVLTRNGYVNKIEFEYLLVNAEKTGWWVSNYRTYFLNGDMLPTYNNGTTSGKLDFIFRKKADGEIEVYCGNILIVTVKKAGFYVPNGITVEPSGQNFTVGADGRISDPAGFFGGPETNFVESFREYVPFGGVINHSVASGGTVKFSSNSEIVKPVVTADEKGEALKTVLSGKYLSLLGDSITTFDGISNVTDNNSTIATGVDKSCYPYYDVDKLEEIYWYKLLKNTGMKLLVNNSIGGSRAYGAATDLYAACNLRCVNLHADTGELAGTDPDVIIVYIGINDVGATDENLENFKKGYGQMINKLKARYNNSDIFVIDLPYPDNENVYPKDKFDSFNQAIENIVSEANLNLIRFSGSVADDAKNLTCDRLHPNVHGMQAYYEVIRDALYEYYCA